MKRLLVFSFSVFFISAGIVFAAPIYRIERSVLPETDSAYYLGTTTPSTNAWAGGIFDQICLTGDTCRTTWPTGGSGAWPFTPSSYAGIANQSTTTPLWLKDTMIIASTTLFTNASTTALTNTGSTWLTSLATAAGTILAVDPDGKIIATTTTAGGVTSVSGTWPILSSGGATPTISWGGIATSTNPTVGLLAYWTAANTLASIATSSIGLLTTDVAEGTNLYFTNARADARVAAGTTTIQGMFSAIWPLAYSAGVISSATSSGSSAGVLSAADWTTFNSKQSALTFTYPLQNSANTVSLAFGTTTANAWSALQSFTNSTTSLATFSTAPWLTSLTASTLLALDTNKQVVSTTTIGWNLIKGTASSIFAFDASGNPTATTSIGTNYITGTLGTINGTTFNRGDSITVTAASSTLLSNSNTWSGTNTFTGQTTLGNASTSLLSVSGQSWFTGLATLGNASSSILSATTLCLTGDSCRTTWPTGSAWPFTPSSYGGVANQSTTTPLWLKDTMVIASTTLFTNASTTNLTAGTSLGIPSGSSQTPTAAGYVAHDTTDNQLKLGIGSATAVFDQRRAFTVQYATTTTWSGTTTLPTIPMPFAMTFNSAQCKTDAGTINVQVSYGQPATNLAMIAASTTMGTFTWTTNNTPPAATTTSISFGTPASSPTNISCTILGVVSGT